MKVTETVTKQLLKQTKKRLNKFTHHQIRPTAVAELKKKTNYRTMTTTHRIGTDILELL